MSSIWELEKVNLFKILCPHNYEKYASCHTFKNYAKNDYVYFEKDNANKVFLINEGKVKIGYYTEKGEEVIKAILGKGEIFGEKSILGVKNHNDFAQSIHSNTQICVIPQDTLLDMMSESTSVSLKVYKFIGLRMKRIERRLEILLFKDTKTRLIEFINDLKEEFGTYEENGKVVVTHPYNQSDIAKLIGTSRPTLNILINELKQEKVIDFKRKKIIFL